MINNDRKMGSIYIDDWQKEALEEIKKQLKNVDTMSDALDEILSWYGFQHWCICKGNDKDVPKNYWKEYRTRNKREKKKLLKKILKKSMESIDEIKSQISRRSDKG